MMDKITITRINELHPSIRAKALDAYTKANNKLGKGVRLRFSHTYRTAAEQNELFAKRPKVTDARAWESYHNYGLAYDIVLLYDKDLDGNFEEASWSLVRDGDGDKVADWKEVTDVLLEAGFKNGFIKNGKKWDFPHFQMDFGYSVKQLKQKIDSGAYDEELVNGKLIKFVRL